jgi:hypothetical protein
LNVRQVGPREKHKLFCVACLRSFYLELSPKLSPLSLQHNASSFVVIKKYNNFVYKGALATK